MARQFNDDDLPEELMPPFEMEDIWASDEEPEQPAEPENVAPPERESCAAKQTLCQLFRSRVWRYSQDAGFNGGVFPNNITVPEVTEPVKQQLLETFRRANRISPTRCIRIARATGLQPIEVCDYFMNFNHPTLKAEMARRRIQHQRVHVFNVYCSFKVKVVVNPNQARNQQ